MTIRRTSSRLKGQPSQTAENVEESGAPSSGSVVEPPPFKIDLPSGIPIEQLSALLPEGTSLENPTPDTVLELYRLVLELQDLVDSNTAELDGARAEAQRKEIETEQAIVDLQNETSRLSGDLQRALGQLTTVRTDRDELATARDALKHQIDTLASSQTSSSSGLLAARQKLEEVERANRNLLGVVDRMKVVEVDQQQEMDSLRDRLKSSRQENTTLHAEVAELRSLEATHKFKIETLNEELILVHEENARYKKDLDEKIQESATLRRSKHAEIVELQTELESLTQTHDATQVQYEALKQTHAQLNQSHTETLQRLNDTKAAMAEQESKFRVELSTQQRLVDLLESRNEEARHRVEDVDREWEKMVKEADDREAQLRESLENERRKVDALEQRVDDLRAVIDKMGSGELPLVSTLERAGSVSVPGTPTPAATGANGSMMLSPTAHLASRFQKSGRTFTEVYADYVRLQAELAAEKQESSRLSECLAQILADIEERAPTLHEQRVEYERIQRELLRLGPQLAEALQERDAEARNARVALDRAAAKEHENTLLERQLSDLSRQLRHVLRELAIKENPALEEEALAAMEDSAGVHAQVQDLTDTDVIITDQLTLFRNIPDLQDQNQRLLRVTRDMSAKMETMEKEMREAAEQVESEAVRRAKVAIEGLHGKIQSQETTERALRKELEMLRGMLLKSSQVPLVSSLGPAEPLREGRSIGGGEIVEGDRLAEMNSILKEMGSNATKVQDELSASQKQVGQLNASLAKANAQIDFLNERHQISEKANEMQRRELTELQARNSKYQAQIASLEISCHQAHDQAQEATAMLNRLRSETTNLQAERSLLKTIESRLSADVNSLNKENARLNSLLRDTQTIQNDMHRAAETDRRRLEGQISSLENQAQELRTELSKELERNRHSTLQKEVEAKELQAKIDIVTAELGSTREKLLVAQANEKHLTTRIEDLVRSLEGSNEKLSVYERRPTGGVQDISSADDLQREVAELRAALRGAELDIETSKNHAEQFKAISATNEQALADLQATYDQYKVATAAETARLEAEVNNLQTRVQNLDKDTSVATEESTKLRRQLDEQRAQFEAEKRDLEGALADVNSAESNAAVLQASVQDDLRRQARIAQEAHDKYERELVEHAKAIEDNTNLKQQLAAAQSTAREQQRAAETAQANLLSSQTSWEAQKETFNKELRDLKARFDDLSKQNAVLHKHLESISTQATTIRQAADHKATLAEGQTAGEDTEGDDAIIELRSVVSYLRKEKEIADLQLDLSRQETMRLRTQVEHLTRNIDETRAQLTAASSPWLDFRRASHLFEFINQLNIFRESNSTLRAECEANVKRSQQLEQQLRKAQDEANPLKAELRAAKAELGAREEQIKLLEAETERWRARNSQLLSQYKQVDPEDLRAAKEESDDLRKQLEATKGDLEAVQTSKADLLQKFQALRNQSKNIIDNQKQAIASAGVEKEQLVARIAELERRVTAEGQGSSDGQTETLRAELTRKSEELAIAQKQKADADARVEELIKSGAGASVTLVRSAASPSSPVAHQTTLKAERDAAANKLREAEAAHKAAETAWEAEKQDLSKKLADCIVMRDKHLLNARKIFSDNKAMRKTLADAGLPVPAPAIGPGSAAATASNAPPTEQAEQPTVTVPESPSKLAVSQAAPVPSQRSEMEVDKPDVSVQPAPSQAVVPAPVAQPIKVEPAPEVPLAKVVPTKEAPSPAKEAVQETVPVAVAAAAPAVVAPPETTTAPPPQPEPKAAPPAPEAKAKNWADEKTAERAALLKAKLAKARANPPTTSVTPAAATTSAPAPAAAPSGPSQAPATAPETSGALPTKPPTAPRGRGRGVVRGARGGPAGRGAGVASAGRGAPTAPLSGGISISGAAKRPMEEQPEGSDSGAKRIRVQRNRQPGGASDAAPSSVLQSALKSPFLAAQSVPGIAPPTIPVWFDKMLPSTNPAGGWTVLLLVLQVATGLVQNATHRRHFGDAPSSYLSSFASVEFIKLFVCVVLFWRERTVQMPPSPRLPTYSNVPRSTRSAELPILRRASDSEVSEKKPLYPHRHSGESFGSQSRSRRSSAGNAGTSELPPFAHAQQNGEHDQRSFVSITTGSLSEVIEDEELPPILSPGDEVVDKRYVYAMVGLAALSVLRDQVNILVLRLTTPQIFHAFMLPTLLFIGLNAHFLLGRSFEAPLWTPALLQVRIQSRRPILYNSPLAYLPPSSEQPDAFDARNLVFAKPFSVSSYLGDSNAGECLRPPLPPSSDYPGTEPRTFHAFDDILLIVFFSHARYDVNLDAHREVYSRYFPNILYIGPASREDKGFRHSYDVFVDSYESDEELGDWYKMAGRMVGNLDSCGPLADQSTQAHHMLFTAVKDHPCYKGYLWAPFDAFLNIARLAQFPQDQIWYHSPFGHYVPNPALKSAGLRDNAMHPPPASISKDTPAGYAAKFVPYGQDGWQWWWGEPHVGLEVCWPAYQQVPQRFRDRLQSLTGEPDRFIGGSADTLYFPATLREDFLDTLSTFLDTDCFLEIALPTTVHMVLPPDQSIAFVDHWWIWMPPLNSTFVRQKWEEGYEVDSFHTYHWGDKGPDGVWRADPHSVEEVRRVLSDSFKRQGMAIP
ncbi:hypothetical protein FRB99_006426 [Tulasnella sp. 403]|nr:hypothetical protein FRB99_006426 [Tulasnella sp. 403]